MISRPDTLLLMRDSTASQLFDGARLARLHSLALLGDPIAISDLTSPEARSRLRRAEVLLTGWGCPRLDADLLDDAPGLKAVLHAGGTVKPHLVDQTCWQRGIRVTSAADANAVPVAEYTLGAILHAGKRFNAFATAYRQHAGTLGAWREEMPPASNYRRSVGLVGLSRIGRRVAALLGGFDFDVYAYDPYCSAESAADLGVRLLSLEELLRCCDIVSLHAPALPETRHLLDAERLALLPDHATVINTARGSLIDTAALTAHCVSGRLSAVLDVTDPEPLPADSPMYQLPNVQLTPHIAGAMGSEINRLADAALDELERYAAGDPARHPVHAGDLARIA